MQYTGSPTEDTFSPKPGSIYLDSLPNQSSFKNFREESYVTYRMAY